MATFIQPELTNSESTESASESWSPFHVVSTVSESSSLSSDPKSNTRFGGGVGILGAGGFVAISEIFVNVFF